MQIRGLQSQAYLPELLVAERDNPDQLRLSAAQRFELCLTTANEMAALHRRGVIPECLGLHGIIVNATGGTIKVTLAGIIMPTKFDWIAASGYALDDLIIKTSDNSLSEKSSVQLLGLLFLKIFQPMLHGEHLWDYQSIDKTSENRVLTFLGQMVHPDPNERPTLNQTIRSLQSISSNAMFVQYRLSEEALATYRKAIRHQKDLEAQAKAREYAARTRPLTWDEKDNMLYYARKTLQEQNEANIAAAAPCAAPASASSAMETTAASAAAAAAPAITEEKPQTRAHLDTTGFFSSSNDSFDDLIASKAFSSSNMNAGPRKK